MRLAREILPQGQIDDLLWSLRPLSTLWMTQLVLFLEMIPDFTSLGIRQPDHLQFDRHRDLTGFLKCPKHEIPNGRGDPVVHFWVVEVVVEVMAPQKACVGPAPFADVL